MSDLGSLINVSMVYEIEGNDFETVLDLGLKIRKVKEELKKEKIILEGEEPDRIFQLGVYTHSTRLGKIFTRFKVDVCSSDAMDIMDKYFKIVGVPSFIVSGSDYEIVERVLKDYGKKLKRKLGFGFGNNFSYSDGKYVVSLTH